MAITFECGCGKTLRARDELAGRKAKCPRCGEVASIPAPEFLDEPDADDGSPYGLLDRDPGPAPARPDEEDQDASRPAPRTTFSENPQPRATIDRARPSTSSGPKARAGGEPSLLEYSYLVLLFALVPLMVSLLGKDQSPDIRERISQTFQKASPEDQARIAGALDKGEVSLDEAIAAMPGGRLDGAHLSRDTTLHWAYAAIAAVAYLLMLGLCFSVERSKAAHLVGVGAFTATVGIVFLLLVQLCSNFRLGGIRGRGLVIVILLILTFIGWSYDSANDSDSNILLSALGFTFGVGLCEELTKALPILFYFKRHSEMGWRGACLWGLASGIGFGVSEGVIYSARHYNGISGLDIYLVRFVSCVALHAMWSASVGIAIARNVDRYEGVEDAAGLGVFLLRVLAVPMALHGFYDTFLKKDMNGWALLVALLSYAWLACHIERARVTHPGAGRSGEASAF